MTSHLERLQDMLRPLVAEEPDADSLAGSLTEPAMDQLDTDVAGLLALHATFVKVAREASLAADVVAERLYEVVGQMQYPLPDGTFLEMKRSASRTKWQHAELIKRCAAAIADEAAPLLYDEETGEMVPVAVLVQQVVGAFSRFGNPSWRVTALRDAGLQVDEFCDERWGRPKPVIVQP